MAACCVLVSEGPRKTQHRHHTKQGFPHTEMGLGRICIRSKHQPLPHSQQVPPRQMMQGHWPACTPLVLRQMDSVPFLHIGLARGSSLCTPGQDREGHIESETRKAIHTRRQVSTGSVGSLPLDREMFQAQSPCLCS